MIIGSSRDAEFRSCLQSSRRRRGIKKLIAISLVVVIFPFLCAAVSLAEDKAEDSIFKYKKELSITDAQEENLRNILSRLQNYIAVKTKELDGLRAELNKMIADKADLDTIRAKLRTIANIQADATCEDIASVRAIEKELTVTQMSNWRSIQENFRKNLQDAQAVAAKAKEDAVQ